MKQYLDLVGDVLNGHHVSPEDDRTGTGYRSVFGRQLRFNLQDGFPLVTTKKVFTKGIIHELLWFLKGDTNIKYLVDNGVSIWTDWPFKIYLQDAKNKYGDRFEHLTLKEFEKTIIENEDFAKEWGDCGPIYGKQWRNWHVRVERNYNQGSGRPLIDMNIGADQIFKVIHSLKENPHSRRHIVNAWNVGEIDDMVLPPCHVMFQFHVRKHKVKEWLDRSVEHSYTLGIDENGKMTTKPKLYLDMQLYQRSADIPLGVPFNIASYALLQSMIAQVVGMTPGEFIYTLGDAHIYDNQMEGIVEQIQRDPLPLPKLELNPDIKNIDDFKFEDINIINYESHPTIKFPVAV